MTSSAQLILFLLFTLLGVSLEEACSSVSAPYYSLSDSGTTELTSFTCQPDEEVMMKTYPDNQVGTTDGSRFDLIFQDSSSVLTSVKDQTCWFSSKTMRFAASKVIAKVTCKNIIFKCPYRVSLAWGSFSCVKKDATEPTSSFTAAPTPVRTSGSTPSPTPNRPVVPTSAPLVTVTAFEDKNCRTQAGTKDLTTSGICTYSSLLSSYYIVKVIDSEIGTFSLYCNQGCTICKIANQVGKNGGCNSANGIEGSAMGVWGAKSSGCALEFRYLYALMALAVLMLLAS